MKILIAALLMSSCLFAQGLSVSVHDPTGAVPDTPLTASYELPSAPVGGASQIVVRFTNRTSNPIIMNAVAVGNAAGSLDATPNFSVTGQFLGKALAANGANAEDVTITFSPTATGTLTGYLQAAYQTEVNGCNPVSTDPTVQCPSTLAAVSTLSGTGTAPPWLLKYNGPNGSVTPQPGSATPISFGNVSTSSSSSLTFTFTNVSASPVTLPAVSLVVPVYLSSAFVLNISSLPPNLAAGASASFTVTFAPGQVQQANAVLAVGSFQYSLSGNGVVATDIDALQISYTDSSGVRTLPNPATPIAFDQVIAGTSGTSTLTFAVTNPSTSYNAVSITQLTAAGAGFQIGNGPSMPASIAPGAAITFQVIFAATSTGTYSGTLAIGSRQFSLTGQGIASAVPAASFHLSEQPLTSRQQPTLSIQLASASTVSAIGELTMTFTPLLSKVTDDPAICFLATSSRKLQVNVAAGGQTATYQGQSALAFQTGSTAGTITFTLTFPNGAPFSQSFTIAPETVQITSVTAVRSNPNLVVTITGFDNTYSASALAFTFSDLSGNVINASPITVDASKQFSNYFFNNNQAGGAFALQATFPVTGDVTQVESVSGQITNSSGVSKVSQTFQ
jgi:hypothetical protein